MLHYIKNQYITIYQTARERLQGAAANVRIVLTSRLTIALETGLDQRRENLLTSDKVGLIILDAAAYETTRPIVLASRVSNTLFQINAIYLAYMALHYVLMFPYSNTGQCPSMMLRNDDEARKRDKLTQQVYYWYYLHLRPGLTIILFLFYRLFMQQIINIQAILD